MNKSEKISLAIKKAWADGKYKNRTTRGFPGWNKGKPTPQVRGELHGRWAGDDVLYGGIHLWIRYNKGLAKDYECSLKDKTCKGRLEHSNISREYRRNLSDWWILCKSHHVRYDRGLL